MAATIHIASINGTPVWAGVRWEKEEFEKWFKEWAARQEEYPPEERVPFWYEPAVQVGTTWESIAWSFYRVEGVEEN
jgi:hypothetical protein